MLLIIISLVVIFLVLIAVFFLFADGDLTLMCAERFGHRAGECICVLHTFTVGTYFMHQSRDRKTVTVVV